MTTAVRSGGGGSDVFARPQSSSLADVLDTILDKGLVIDAYVRVSLVGLEILTIDARIVVASVDTYLRFAEAVNRLDLTEQSQGLVEGLTEGAASAKTRGALEGVGETLHDALGGGRDEGERRAERRRRRDDR